MSERFQLVQGDCLDVMGRMVSGSIDVIITSPPYNLGTSSGGGIRGAGNSPKSKWNGGALTHGYADCEDGMPDSEYVSWQHACVREMWRLLSDHGAIFYNHKPRIQWGEVQLPTRFNPDLPLRQVIIWNRRGGININPNYFLGFCEWLLVIAKPAFRLRDKEASLVGDVWDINADSNNTHPAPFPVALPKRILASLDPTRYKTVLDPFVGSGSTLIAAAQVGLQYGIGIDLTQDYLDLARKRIDAAARQPHFDFSGPPRPHRQGQVIL